ncbi:MAG: hypothetical protein IH856_14250 [Deltaproteobacteria bacterium]|nr:hypothetical protein [Deltaproteobacteria bacterium]MCZ6449464.1 hypothetical protein [Deltaproteobacteria bacterium]MCZ6547833.1 hypothetical protein [Deltaproteobacteria bacterium]MCZ6561670.1 hypothetical protein [Deltaproteobacteria bacterium]
MTKSFLREGKASEQAITRLHLLYQFAPDYLTPVHPEVTGNTRLVGDLL